MVERLNDCSCGEIVTLYYHDMSGDEKPAYEVVCTYCGKRMIGSAGGFDTKEEAIRAWNEGIHD